MLYFNCDSCSRQFNSKFALQGHSRMHGKSNGTNKQIMCCCIITKEEVKASYLEEFQRSLVPCKVCNKLFKNTDNAVFCSHSCSATFNNSLRSNVSNDQKQKVSESLKNYFLNNPKTSKKSRHFKELDNSITDTQLYDNHKSNRECKHCHIIFMAPTYKKYCISCSPYYMADARNRYKFTLNVYNYPDLFDLDRIKEIGWFAPGGKSGRWNINGLSRDHKVSVNEAILNNYDYYYITHPMNCEIISHKMNNKKKTKSSITYEELVKLVDDYDRKMAPSAGLEPATT